MSSGFNFDNTYARELEGFYVPSKAAEVPRPKLLRLNRGLAEELGLDPIEVRRKNFLKAPTFTQNDLMVNSYGLPECIDWVEQASSWIKKRKQGLPDPGPGKKKGIGFACSHYISGASTYSQNATRYWYRS